MGEKLPTSTGERRISEPSTVGCPVGTVRSKVRISGVINSRNTPIYKYIGEINKPFKRTIGPNFLGHPSKGNPPSSFKGNIQVDGNIHINL